MNEVFDVESGLYGAAGVAISVFLGFLVAIVLW